MWAEKGLFFIITKKKEQRGPKGTHERGGQRRIPTGRATLKKKNHLNGIKNLCWKIFFNIPSAGGKNNPLQRRGKQE